MHYYSPLSASRATSTGKAGGQGAVALLLNPLTQAEGGGRAKRKHEVAGEGTPAFAPGTGTRALGEPSEPTDERGNPAPEFSVRGAESGVPFLSVPFFGHAKKGTRRTGAEPC
jgi:hypothetical protein